MLHRERDHHAPRHPLAGHNLQSELILLTGAVDAMVVDIQCIWPASTEITQCYGSEFITTEAWVRIPGDRNIPFHPETADKDAQEIIRLAIAAFKRRDNTRVEIPPYTSTGYAGFSVEAVMDVLARMNPEDPLQPMIDAIAAGDIYGAVGIVGCPSLKIRDTSMTEEMTKELLSRNILVVTSGCTAQILAQAEFLTCAAVDRYCGERLWFERTGASRPLLLDCNRRARAP